MIISVQKIKDISWFFPVLLLIKESFNLIGCETQQNTFNQKMVTIYMQKKKKKKKRTKIIWFFPQILMIKEFCNLIGWEAQLATPNQKRKFQMLHFLDSYPHAKNLRH